MEHVNKNTQNCLNYRSYEGNVKNIQQSKNVHLISHDREFKKQMSVKLRLKTNKERQVQRKQVAKQ